MKCENCGRECVPISSETLTIAENTYQTSREYKCLKCKKVYTVTDDPVKLIRSD